MDRKYTRYQISATTRCSGVENPTKTHDPPSNHITNMLIFNRLKAKTVGKWES